MTHEYAPPVYCRHYACQCAAAEDLAWMSERLNRPDLLAEGVDIHRGNKEVRCRQQTVGRPSRSGAPNAPLPPRKEA